MRGLRVVQAIGLTIAVVMMAACSADAYLPTGPQVPEGFQFKPNQCRVEAVRAVGITAERQWPACDSIPATPVTGGDR